MADGLVTVGVSIPVPAPFQDELRDWRRRSGDPLADLVTPHVTLIPPTPLPAEQLDAVLDELRERCAATASFMLRLRGTGTFRPVSEVVFVAIAEGISSCEKLSDRLMVDQLRAPRSFPYHPHVTVAQDVPAEKLDEVFRSLEQFRADFLVDQVCAHRLEDDGTWHPLAAFPLSVGGSETS